MSSNISLSRDSSSSVLGSCSFISVQMFNPYNMTDRPDSVQPLWTFLVVVNAIASPVTVITNALIIWAILGDEHIRSSVFNLLLAALALTDFFVGLIVEPLFIFSLVRLLQDRYSPCFLSAYFISGLLWCIITLLTFAMASMERYFAVEHPEFYQAHTNSWRKVVIVIMAVIWLVTPAVVISSSISLSIHNPDLVKIPSKIVIVVMILIVVYCTSKVFITAYRQSRTIAVQIAAVQPQPNNGKIKEYKRVFTLTILVLASVIFYCPYIVVTAIEMSQGENVTDFFRYSSESISVTFIHIQSLINPIIMSLRLSYIRQRIKDKLLCST